MLVFLDTSVVICLTVVVAFTDATNPGRLLISLIKAVFASEFGMKNIKTFCKYIL